MLFIRRWKNNRMAEKFRRRMLGEMRFRQSMREINGNEKRLKAACEQAARQAGEAEKTGNHALASRLAEQAMKLKKYMAFSIRARDSAEATHAVGRTSSALTDLMRSAKGLMKDLAYASGAGDMATLRENMLITEENARLLMEQGSMLLEGLEDEPETANDDGREACLRELMRSAFREQRMQELKEANEKLEKLQAFRTGEIK